MFWIVRKMKLANTTVRFTIHNVTHFSTSSIASTHGSELSFYDSSWNDKYALNIFSFQLNLKIVRFTFIWRTFICICFKKAQNFESRLHFVTKYNHKIFSVLLSSSKLIELWLTRVFDNDVIFLWEGDTNNQQLSLLSSSIRHTSSVKIWA